MVVRWKLQTPTQTAHALNDLYRVATAADEDEDANFEVTSNNLQVMKIFAAR
jgi:hypothetical protein